MADEKEENVVALNTGYVPPPNYVPIAVRDDYCGNTVISYCTETGDFMISISGDLMSRAVTLKEIEALSENFKDVIEMKGSYLFIKEYDTRGNKT